MAGSDKLSNYVIQILFQTQSIPSRQKAPFPHNSFQSIFTPNYWPFWIYGFLL
jgi:hypothetical protein